MAALGALLVFTGITLAQEARSAALARPNLSAVSQTKNNRVSAKSSAQKALTARKRGKTPGFKESARPEGNVTIPGLPHPMPAERSIAPTEVDTKPLWALLKLGKYRTLEQRIAVLKKYYPGWEPPAPLAASLYVEEAAQRRNDQEMLAAYARWPEFFSCTRIGNLWELADADLRLGRAADGLSVYKKILASCANEDDRLVTLARALTQFSPGDIKDLIEAERSRALGSKASKIYNDIRYHFYARWFYKAAKGRKWAAASHAAQAIAPEVKVRRDAGLASAIGWMELKRHKAAAALPWFKASFGWKPEADTALGLAVALRALGKFNAAYGVASRFPQHRRLTDLRKDILARRARSAYIAGKYDRVLRLVAKSVRLGPLRHDVALFDGWAHYQKGDAAEAAPIFERLYRKDRDAPSAIGLIFSLMRLKHCRRALHLAAKFPGALTAILEPEKGIKLKTPTGPIVGLGATTVPSDTRYLFFSAWLFDAINARHYKTADWIVRKIQGGVRAKRSARLNASVGWVELNVKKYGAAAAWFEDAIADASPNWPGMEDAAYGLALAQLKAGKYGAAAATAKVWGPRFARLSRLYGEALMEQARKDYGAGNYKKSLELARRAANALPGRRDPKMLEAWNYYHLRDFARAEAEFESLYRAHPDRESALGLAYTLQRQGDLDELQQLAKSLPGPLQSLATSIVARQDFDAGQFLRAASLAPKQFPDLEGIASPAVGAGFTWWSISGTPGTSRLVGMAETIQARETLGFQRFTLDLNVLQLDSGGITPAPMVNTVGSVAPGKPARFSPTSELADGFEPVISWLREGERVSPFVQLGLTPLGGEVAPTAIGNAGVNLLYGRTKLTAALTRQPIAQSLLSFTGLRDPATGVAFGRVVESGGKFHLFRQLSSHWGAAVGGRVGRVTGVNVANNRDLFGSASLDYSLNLKRFQYLSIGPSYQYESFQRNLSGFTFGNGGYYSPQSFNAAGIAASFQTRESRPLLVKGTAFAGWQTARENAAPLFPFYNSGAFTPAIPSTGPNDYVALQAVYVLGPYLALEGNVAYLKSPQYNFLAVGGQLRITFGSRREMFSADLWQPSPMTPIPLVP